MKLFIRLFVFLILSSSFVACSNDDPPSPGLSAAVQKSGIITYKATLNGAAEVPANSSSATGTATLTYDPSTKIYSLTATHTVVSPTGAHVHKGAVGVSGPVVVDLGSPASPIGFEKPYADDKLQAEINANLSDLDEGKAYINIHSAAYPGGEIRGQFIRQ